MFSKMSAECFYAGGPSHALLWPYKESVFRGITAWRSVTWRCEAVCKTHRSRYGSRPRVLKSDRPLPLSLGLHSVFGHVFEQGGGGGWGESVSIMLYFWKPHETRQRVHMHRHEGPVATGLPSFNYLYHTHPHIFTWTHAAFYYIHTLSATYGIGSNLLFTIQNQKLLSTTDGYICKLRIYH